MRFFFEIVIIVAMGLGLGGALSKVSIEDNLGFGALTIGQWTAWPAAGSQTADPYTKAKVAAAGEVPLGAAEGIAFHGKNDLDGNPLKLNCSYNISGQTPDARLWTLAAHHPDGSVVQTTAGLAAALSSRSVVREPSGRFVILTGNELASGNWLETTGTGTYELIFRLYDSQITANAGLVDPEMPIISLLRCSS